MYVDKRNTQSWQRRNVHVRLVECFQMLNKNKRTSDPVTAMVNATTKKALAAKTTNM